MSTPTPLPAPVMSTSRNSNGGNGQQDVHDAHQQRVDERARIPRDEADGAADEVREHRRDERERPRSGRPRARG